MQLKTRFNPTSVIPLRSSLAALAACVAAACGNPPPEAKPPAAPPPLAVSVLEMAPQRVPIVIEAVGQAEGSRDVEVRARVSGILEKRLFAEGDRVRAGAVLFRIDRAPFEITLAQAQASLAEQRVKNEQAQRESARLKELAASRAISQKEFDDSTSIVKQSATWIAQAEAKVREAELNLSYTSVVAPISGVTGRALRSEGSLITAGNESSLLTTLTQVDPIWVRFSIAEAEYNRIRDRAKQAEVSIARQDGKNAARGRLNFTASTVDAKLGTVQLRAEFANPGAEWLPGQFASVRILTGEQEAFLVPQSAVLQLETTRSVWVVAADGKAVAKPVQTANWIGTDWVVTGGLAAGDKVIVDNLIKLRPGASVQPKPADGAPPKPPAAVKS